VNKILTETSSVNSREVLFLSGQIMKRTLKYKAGKIYSGRDGSGD